MRPDERQQPTLPTALFPLLMSVVAAMLVYACSSSGGAQVQSAYPPPPVVPEMSVRRANAADVLIDMTLTGLVSDTAGNRFVRQVNKIQAVIIHPTIGRLDTLTYQLAAGNGENGGPARLVLNAQERWTNAQAIDYDSLYIETIITVQNGSRYGDMQTFMLAPASEKQDPLPPVTLEGSVENVTDTSAVFVALASRQRTIPDEYFPSSEKLRVTLLRDGAIVWSSVQGQFFAQAIYPVEPNLPGKVKRYELLWNGLDNNGKPLPPGDYTAQLMLPVRPYPYSTTIPFPWKTGDE